MTMQSHKRQSVLMSKLARQASLNRAIHYIPELDDLPGIAVILVVIFHARKNPAVWFTPFPFLHSVLNVGPTGVDLFFVLSGFLITSILLSTKFAAKLLFLVVLCAARP